MTNRRAGTSVSTPRRTASGAATSRGLVVVVDDEPEIVEIAAQVLESAGFEVARADGGARCLELLEETEFDAVLTDIRMDGMDGMDGFALIGAIRRHEPALRTLVMTGHDSYAMVRRALAAGAYDYLDKPLDRHEAIVAAVARAVEATRLDRSNARLLERLTESNAELAGANATLVTLNRRLHALAHTDTLTGLFNRRHVDATLARAAPDVGAPGIAPLSVALIDLDHFKRYNDAHGHEGGDRALRAVARTMRAAGRPGDTIGRYGGEEFIAVLPGTGAADALAWARMLREAIAATNVDGRTTLAGAITASIGVATRTMLAGAGRSGVDALLRDADAALYAAKASGRNRVEASAATRRAA